MPPRFPTIDELRELTESARREAIEELVVGELRSALLLTDTEELPLDAGFFDLGLTSLRLTEIKRAIESALDCDIDTTVLFARPTAAQLIDYLSA